MPYLSLSHTLCTRCGLCATVCSSYVLEQKQKGGEINIVRPDMCINCGHCVDVCPTGAFQHQLFNADNIHTVNKDLLPSPESLMELIRSRRSNRTITDADIPQQSLNMITEAARYAPTAENSRNVSIHVLTDPTLLQGIEDKVMNFFTGMTRILMLKPINNIIKALMPTLHKQILELSLMDQKRKSGKRPATINAKAILLITAPKNSRFGYQDCNLAYQNASLMAQSLGISQIYLGFVQTAFEMWGTKKTAKLLHIPTNQKVFAIMALGIPAIKYHKYTEPNSNS